MSRTPLPFAPDPTKWIDTSSSTKPKRAPTQRPLVGFRNTFATPPPSTNRKVLSRTRLPDDVSNDLHSHQTGIAGWLTPPTTASAPRPRLDRLRREVAKELNEGSPSVIKGKGKSKAVDAGSRRTKAVWRSDEAEEDRKDEDDPPHAGPSKPRATSRSRSPSIEAISPSKILPSDPHPVSSIPQALKTPQAAVRTGVPNFTPPSRTKTPIPEDVLAIHRRLCGQEVKEKRPVVLTKQEQLAEAVLERSRKAKVGARTRNLVQLEDDEIVPPVSNILMHVDANAAKDQSKTHHRTESLKRIRPFRDAPSGTLTPRKRRKQTPEEVQVASPLRALTRPTSPFRPTSSPEELVTPRAAATRTPRKREPSHHQVTPPKSHTPKNLAEYNDKLFAFPPKPPDFGAVERSSPEPEAAHREWEPVAMQAETLMTWSLGGGAAEAPKSSPPMAGTTNPPANRPHPTPVQRNKRPRSDSKSSDTESLAPSLPSQNFPHLVTSSPRKESKSGEVISANIRLSPPRQTTPVLATGRNLRRTTSDTPARSADNRWQALSKGILSVPVKSEQSMPLLTPTQKKKMRKSDTGSQAVLGAFGFFPTERVSEKSKRRSEAFEKEWDEEEDVTIEEDHEKRQSDASRASTAADGRALGRVPSPPPHPSLRPAGLAELRRRKQTAQETPPTPGSGHSSGRATPAAAGKSKSSPPSSSLTSNELFPELSSDGPEDADAKAWFDNIQQRRSSEFGSFRDDL